VKNAPAPPMRRTVTRLGLIGIAGLLATAAPTVPAQAVPLARAAAMAVGRARSGPVSSLCRRYQHFAVVTAQGAHFVVKNDNYGGQTECLAVRGDSPNFTVTQSQLPAWHAKPQAYPFILRGCSWGTCSAPGSGLPKPVSALRHPVATWYTTQVPRGEWDAAFDIWFGTHPMTTGQADGAEIMIWLNARRIPVPPRTEIVRIEHVRFYLLHWRACHGGTCWNYIQFRRVWPVQRVRHLHLLPFIHRAERRAWIQPVWWLENIEAGFELWQGGAGLATDWFWARA
jgi:Glycosyl hydrolase family 12